MALTAFVIFREATRHVPTIETRQEIDSAMLQSRVMLMAELSTLVFRYTEVGIFEDQTTMSVFGAAINVPGTARRFIIKFDGEMRFGIDISGIEIDVEDYEVSVNLPRATILTHFIHIDTITLMDERTGLFASLDLDDYTYFISERQGEIEIRESTAELLARAQNGVEDAIYSLLRMIVPDDEYTINFTWIN